jgi:chromosome segregation ATPase
MNKKIWKYLLLIVVFALGITSVILTYNIKMEKQRAEMQKEIDQATRRSKQLQKRYTEQKTLLANFQRARGTLEGQINTLRQEIADLREEYASLEKEKNVLGGEISKYMKMLANSEDQKKSIAAKNKQLETEIKQAKNDYEQQIYQKEAEKQEVESKLREVGQRLEICNEKNARLCIIADEALQMYENKSAINSILGKEPVFQLKRVELEKFIQEYRDRIEANKQ